MNRHRALISLVLMALVAWVVWTSACSRIAYRQMNDPARDAWQQPEAVLQALHIAPGQRVADLGAGGGYFTFRLAEAVGPTGKVYAVDVDQTGLDLIREQSAQRNERDRIIEILASQDDPRLPSDGVDLIFTCNTYHHLHDRIAYFTALKRYLRPDGRVAILEFKEGGWIGSLFGHATSKEVVRKELEAAGYHAVEDFDFLPKQHFQVFRPNPS
jgi:ubiquinone/menaquinone biosynthesis C-methylase UbiE